ncbi:IMP cyclohydrolase [uncultured archaeon]|nr:IMP cyclohydrolase [uncultured archaeon]
MYVGRIVVVGRTEGKSWAGYRVSSRSFPNRIAEVRGSSILVSPMDPKDLARNPYIAYNCIRTNGDVAVVSNGTQTDMVMERVDAGAPPLDAIAFSLVAYGYERDELDTPRIAGAVCGNKAWLGIAMKGEFRFKEIPLSDNDAFMVATYEKTGFEPVAVSGIDASAVAKAAYDLPLERPVCSAAAFQSDEEFELAVYNPA